MDETVRAIAESFVGEDEAGALVEVWRLAEDAIRGFMPNPLYFLWGVWYRIEIRPLVPDIDAIPEEQRAYYEGPMLSTHHNPNRVDLSRDVMFTLMTPGQAATAVERIDERALSAIDAAVRAADGFEDVRDRLTALRCWMTTRRNVAAWIAHALGFLRAKGKRKRAAHRERLDEMVESEIGNARAWLALWRESGTEFMAVSKGTETTFIYDRAFGDHLERKIDLMRRYRDREPRVDPSFMYRVADLPGGSS